MFKQALLLLLTGPSFTPLQHFLSYSANVDITLSCIACVSQSSEDQTFSWQGSTCHDDSEEGECPVDELRCCKDADCCATDGCRSPDSIFLPEGGDEATAEYRQTCSECCDELESLLCQHRTWVPSLTNETSVTKTERGTEVPWFNTRKESLCINTYVYPPSCPPCALCTTHDEMEMHELSKQQLAFGDSQCSKEMCDTLNAEESKECSVERISENDCKCFCQEADILAMKCPHMVQLLWQETSLEEIVSDMEEKQNQKKEEFKKKQEELLKAQDELKKQQEEMEEKENDKSALTSGANCVFTPRSNIISFAFACVGLMW
eukprot:CAMPEP_0195521418 /NCGR_PEP_ID=MMETSP0794_2-20130614/18627_1 /TAXON_ID=515487 /ORGANISM="Stephanopyxis turris, Strain CCMP 815" /LENGTH=319 /DNA_ID=CAMNT_0040650967 /DNA_START=104 /DNA_END=1060 /DNA_ORIENTATION=-